VTIKKEQESGGGAGGAGVVEETKKDEDLPQPNPAYEAGSKLSSKLGIFPPELYGKPIEDLDDFYRNQKVSD